ncbi:LytR/AlgR family response regulator transcription factor [Zunongwangia endophytica]|uniref:LytR/AlgR family response regulator transcription factor n=1 Tax=Zunongwangia endophytica TaxID=1808945 RepID=A0ABV8HE97_9FLAO|nr:LytTR family DNA-binding domain-containing protein [Zunongwangia endophytica]MDN3593550.1 LytTR family DNA-binding domain-containing protein [Zunongwangia endophytica]
MSASINCILVDDEPVALDILESHLSKIDDIHILARCNNATEAFNVISKENVQLIFLDINMPGISGISFAKSINSTIQIIFTTAYREYAIDGFDLHAADYLLKPISFDRLIDAISNFRNQHSTKLKSKLPKKEAEFIFVKIDRQMVKIDFNDLLYIESYSDYLKIHLLTETKITRETITAIEEKLPRSKFIRTHRSFIVAIDSIDSYTNEQVVIHQKSIPISRSYKEQVLEKFQEFH